MQAFDRLYDQAMSHPLARRGQRLALGRDNQGWMRFLVAIGIVGYVILLAVRAGGKWWDPTAILTDPLLILAPGAVAVYILLRWPHLGVLGVVVGSMVIPFSIGTGTSTNLHAGILMVGGVLGIWLFQTVSEKRTIRLPRSRTVTPLLIFLVVVLLSFLVGQLPWFVFGQPASLMAQLGGVSVFVLSGGAFLLGAIYFQNLRWLKWTVAVFLALGAIYIIGQILPPTRGISARVINRGVYSNSMFWLWVVSLAFGQLLFNDELRKPLRGGLVALLIATFYVSIVVNQDWTSGWLPAAVSVGVILLFSRSVWSWVAIVLAGIVGAAKFDSVQRVLFAGDNRYSLTTRLEAWRIIGEMMEVNPIFGLGPSNYYWYTPLFPILGWQVEFNSHNNYVDIIAQTGILGLLAFLWFAGHLVWLAIWLRDRVPAGFPRAFAYGALGGLIGTLAAGMLGDWFLPFVYNVGLNGMRASLPAWLFLGGLVALEQHVGGSAE